MEDINLKIKYLIRKFIICLPPKIAHSIWFFLRNKKIMHWKNPRTYDEKIHWLIVNRLDQKFSKYADKFEMRKYVEECGLGELLIPLYGVWESLEEVDFDKLPYPNIMKLTHGSGKNFYFVMHSPEEKELVKKKLAKGMKVDLSVIEMEYHYHFIRPRIICEKLLGSGKEKLTDYKVVCTKGTPVAVLVCQNRDQGRDYYSLEWKHLKNYTLEKYQSGKKVDKPKGLDTMIKAAAKLSQKFELARIDFYDIEGQVYVGEITLTPAAGSHAYLSWVGEEKLGNAIKLDINV